MNAPNVQHVALFHHFRLPLERGGPPGFG